MNGYSFDHLLALSTPIGTFEHAAFTEPRPEHGYCSDDVARVLVVATREPRPTRPVRELAMTACRFLAAGQDPTGRIRNRRTVDGRWHGRFGTEDCWGRAQWGFGTAARRSGDSTLRQMALAYYGHGVQQRSSWPRAMAFAALAAGEILALDPHHLPSQMLLADAATTIGRPPPEGTAWAWPEPRLTYANAVLPEALLIAGDRLGRAELVDDGLRMLAWLLDRQTRDGHLSPSPAAGDGPEERADHNHNHNVDGPGGDQQPIEVAALADACRRAFDLTADPAWLRGVDAAVRWFLGDNDSGMAMWDPATGGGYDGLQATGVNQNQGAESTLALLSTLQLAAELDRLSALSGR